MGGFGLVIPEGAKQSEGAWEFMKWWTTQPENGVAFAKLSGQNTSGITDLHSRPLAFKELTVEPLFKRPDMPADRARRDIQCFSRFAEGVQPRGNFKSAQRIQWW